MFMDRLKKNMKEIKQRGSDVWLARIELEPNIETKNFYIWQYGILLTFKK